jgi:amino acid permease
VTLFLIATFVIFLLPNTYFAWFEYVTSIIKIFLFILIIIVGITVICGAGPDGYMHEAVNYTELGAFKNGFGVRKLLLLIPRLYSDFLEPGFCEVRTASLLGCR